MAKIKIKTKISPEEYRRAWEGIRNYKPKKEYMSILEFNNNLRIPKEYLTGKIGIVSARIAKRNKLEKKAKND